MTYDKLVDEKVLSKTVDALKLNGFSVDIVNNSSEARKKILEIIPRDAELMTMSSQTLIESGILNELDMFVNNAKKMFGKLDDKSKRKLGASPDWTIGSVHAITQDGKIVVASATGSQLPAYAYASPNVVFVVGTQKIVKDLDDAFKRINEYVLPLEDARAMKAYGMHSSVNKLLIINKEFMPRVKIIFVKEKLGF